MNIRFNPSFTGNKNKKHSNLAAAAGLASAIAMSPSVETKAQNNKLQERFNQFITSEFKKADTNPSDYYVTKKELNEYIKDSKGIRFSDFDENGDKKLNIDEFKKIAAGGNKSPKNNDLHQVKNYEQPTVLKNQTYNSQTQVKTSKSHAQLRQEARDIISKLAQFPTKTITTPGILWGTNTKNVYDYDKAFSNLRRINEDNLLAVVKEAGGSIIQLHRLHTFDITIGYTDKANKIPYCQKAAKYLGKVMDDYATKHGLHFEELDEYLAAIKAGDGLDRFYDGGYESTNKLEKAYKLLTR